VGKRKTSGGGVGYGRKLRGRGETRKTRVKEKWRKELGSQEKINQKKIKNKKERRNREK